MFPTFTHNFLFFFLLLQVTHALMKLHEGKAFCLMDGEEREYGGSMAVPLDIVQLSILVLHKGALFSVDVFRETVDAEEVEMIREAVEERDYKSLELASCEAVGWLLLERMREEDAVLSYEEAQRLSMCPWNEIEESLLSLPSQQLDLLVYLCAFFRLFRNFYADHMMSPSFLCTLLFTSLVSEPTDNQRTSASAAEDFGSAFMGLLLDKLPSHWVRNKDSFNLVLFV